MNAFFIRTIVSRFALLAFAAMAIAGCRSRHVEVTVENRTGAAIQLLEVDYPSASFGAGTLASGADYKYRIQVRGTGPIKVQYTGADGKQRQSAGPLISEGDEGQLQIVLFADGRAQFTQQLADTH
jgi:hypothetical protein